MSWLEKISLYRRANLSNVFLIETEDPKRLKQLSSAIPHLLKKGDRQVTNVYIADLQLRKITPELKQGRSMLQQIYDAAAEKPIAVLLKWVLTREHATMIMDFVIAASQSNELYLPRSEKDIDRHRLSSTIFIFTSSLDFFPDSVRRLCAEIEVSPSSPEERAEILKFANASEDAIHASAGLNLFEVETAALISFIERRKVDALSFKNYKVRMLKTLGLTYEEPDYGFEAVGGYNKHKKFFRQRIINVLKNPSIPAKYGISNPRGVLLFGMPGTGKTWFAKAIAKEAELPLIKLDASDFLRGVVGESESRAKKITRIIESMAPVIVFIDEADQLFQSREAVVSTDSGVFRRVQNILLDWLGNDKRKSFVIMATNYLHQFDFAAVRAGRIDYAIPVMLPDKSARKQILEVHLKIINKPKVAIDVDFDRIAEWTNGFTGAELKTLTELAKIYAMEQHATKITTEHYSSALGEFDIDISARRELVDEMIKQAKSVETVIVPKEFLAEQEINITRKDLID